MQLKEIISKYDAFIFDFDGVIVDSMEIKADAFAALYQDLGPRVMQEVKAYHLSHGGVSRYEKFRYFSQEFFGKEITAQESDALDRRYSDLVVDRVIQADAISGVMEFLSLIKANTKFCCVVSATPQKEMRHIVHARKMSCFFNEVLGSPASKKENLGWIIKNNGLAAARAVYFGDAQADYEAAQKYGIDFVGVTYGVGTELIGLPGIVRINNFNG